MKNIISTVWVETHDKKTAPGGAVKIFVLINDSSQTMKISWLLQNDADSVYFRCRELRFQFDCLRKQHIIFNMHMLMQIIFKIFEQIE